MMRSSVAVNVVVQVTDAVHLILANARWDGIDDGRRLLRFVGHRRHVRRAKLFIADGAGVVTCPFRHRLVGQDGAAAARIDVAVGGSRLELVVAVRRPSHEGQLVVSDR